MPTTRQRGAALILVLGIVTMLAFLVAAFALLTSIERSASRNYRDGERARAVAHSGLERAKFELRRAVTTPGYAFPWVLYDANNPLPAIHAIDSAPYDPSFRPSFAMDLNPVPDALTPQPYPPGTTSSVMKVAIPWPTGVVASSYYQDKKNPAFAGDYYSVRVADANSLLYVNDQNPQLKKMLTTLIGELVSAEYGAMDLSLEVPAVSTPAELAARILSARPEGGFRKIEELKTIVTGVSTDPKKPINNYDSLARYLTCSARVDRKVIAMGESKTANLKILPRAPINLNMASKPVLVAVLNGISYAGGAVDLTMARNLAQELIEYRANPDINPVNPLSPSTVAGSTKDPVNNPNGDRKYGFQKWNELAYFLTHRSLAVTDVRIASAILADVNPNTDLNKFAPDLSIYRPVDKTDLTGATTELCLAPGGIFEIDSLGIVLGTDAIPVAQCRIRSTVRIFERYVETTQGDFELNRIDPEPPATIAKFSELRGLRDVTTLPEFRNAGTAKLTGATAEEQNLFASDFDGQVTFNTTTEETISNESAYSGYIGRDLNGKYAAGGTFTQDTTSPVTATAARSVDPTTGKPLRMVAGDVASLTGGPQASDLAPLGVLVGRGGRSVAYPQKGLGSTPHHVPDTKVELKGQVPSGTGIGGSDASASAGAVFDIVATVDAWDYDAADRGGVELWFKPGFNPTTGGTVSASSGPQIIYAWDSDKPQKPPVTVAKPSNPSSKGLSQDQLTSIRKLCHDTFDANKKSYLDAVAKGGPKQLPPADPTDIAAPGGSAGGLPPPPGSLFGDLPQGNFPYGTPPPELPNAGVEADAAKYAQRVEDWYYQQMVDSFNKINNENLDVNIDDITWGGQSHLRVWLEPSATAPDAPPAYKLHCKFKMDPKPEAQPSLYPPKLGGGFGSGFGGPVKSDPTGTFSGDNLPPGTVKSDQGYEREWVYDVDLPVGTWHHCLFSFQVFIPKTAAGLEAQHTFFFADGHYVKSAAKTGMPNETNDKDMWPTEIHAQAQIVVRVIDKLIELIDQQFGNMFFLQNSFDPEKYRHNMQIPLGPLPILFGKGFSGSTMGIGTGDEASESFLGILDNVILQANWCKFLSFVPTTGTHQHFDMWRPSLGKTPDPKPPFGSGPDDYHLTFRKHTPALEWDRPIRVVSYEWTSWKQSDTGKDYLDLGLV